MRTSEPGHWCGGFDVPISLVRQSHTNVGTGTLAEDSQAQQLRADLININRRASASCHQNTGTIEIAIKAQRSMAMASNIEATKKGYESFQRGDIPGLLKDLIDDNCTWVIPGPKDKLPWAGTFRGKQEISNFFAQVAQNLEYSEFGPHEMIEQGDTVVALGTATGRARKTGKTVKSEWAHVFKYKQGKVVLFQEYTDTTADVLAMS
jgi:uncharacterized protein